jgi:hypothetical protein
VEDAPTGSPADEETPAPRRFTLASLLAAVCVCAAWWLAAVAGYFAYAQSRSDTVAAADCTTASCPSERTALLTLGFFGLLPTAFVGLLLSMVVLVFVAQRLRLPWLLGTVAALAGMAVAAAGFITLVTYDS